MKYFGFIKEHDKGEYSESISDLLLPGIENPERKNVIDYLKKGVLCVPLMGTIEDAKDNNDDSFIGYCAIYTDGVWLWPQYIISYLEKYPTMKIDTSFISQVRLNKNKKLTIKTERIKELEKKYLVAAGFH